MDPPEATPCWFGPADRPLLGWLSAGAGGPGPSGVAIVPPFGYAHLTSHRALRQLAEALADRGHLVLRFDPDGTGDSAGDAWDAGRVDAWRASVAAAVDELRARDCATITLVGLRLSATFALLDGARVGADAVVAWAPVAAGKRYAKEIRLLGTALPDGEDRGCGPAFASAGDLSTGPTLEALAALDLRTLEGPPAPRVLLVDDRPGTLAARLAELGADVTVHPATGSAGILETSAEKAVVPEALLARIAEWVGDAPAGPRRALAPAPASAPLTWKGGPINETVVRLGADRLVAILTEPPDPAPDAATILLLNSGSEPHVGPGRAWVTFARDLARAGHRAVRLDFRGWGESPPAPPGSAVEPYADHCRADLVTAVRALRGEGHARVVPFGLCSAAWVVLKVAVDEPLAGVIALNPQLYWERGQPHLLTYDENWEYRTPARARDVRGARWGAWTALDVLGVRPVAARWLDALVRTRTPVTLLFAAGDDGLHHLRVRLGRRFAAALRSPTVTLVEVADIDHSMYRLWRRPAIVAALDAALVAAGAEA